jgi:hypothetical protein
VFGERAFLVVTHFAVNFKYALEGFRNSAGIWANTGNTLGVVAGFSVFALLIWLKTMVKSGWMFCSVPACQRTKASGGEGKENSQLAWEPFFLPFKGFFGLCGIVLVRMSGWLSVEFIFGLAASPAGPPPQGSPEG